VFAFWRGDERCVFVGSADLMPRNLDTRVELVAPVAADPLADEVVDVLERSLADTVDAWELGPDGTWRKRSAGDEPRSVQRELVERYAARAVDAQPTPG
jgi:polyphosphate kinase